MIHRELIIVSYNKLESVSDFNLQYNLRHFAHLLWKETFSQQIAKRKRRKQMTFLCENR